jgi:DNA-binding GntR family transcriptional regulator
LAEARPGDVARAVADDAPPGFATLYERLRTGVLRGELAPGAVVSQVQLARQYKISRAPLREALRMLQYEGLVDAEPGRRSRIALVGAADLEELYAQRIVLEALAIRLTVPHLDPRRTDALGRVLEDMEAASSTASFEAWEVPHRAFHRGLVADGGARLLATIEVLSEHAERYRRIFLTRPRAWSSAASEHAAILEACRDGDAREAASRLAAHYATTALTVCAALDPEHEPTRVRESLRLVREAGSGRDA